MQNLLLVFPVLGSRNTVSVGHIVTIINSRPLASDLHILFSTAFLLLGTGFFFLMANLDNHSKICCDFSRYLCTGLKSLIDEKNLVGNKRIKHFCSHWIYPITYKKN